MYQILGLLIIIISKLIFGQSIDAFAVIMYNFSLKERDDSVRNDSIQNSSADVGSQALPVYEEITDSPSVFKYTQCPVYSMSHATTSSATSQMENLSHHEYEDVKLKNSNEHFQMTECSAYL